MRRAGRAADYAFLKTPRIKGDLDCCGIDGDKEWYNIGSRVIRGAENLFYSPVVGVAC